MAGQHSSEADEMRALIGAILFDVNAQITEVITLKEQSKNLGISILNLHTHNMDLASAGGELANNIPTIADDLLVRFRLVVSALEDYRDRP